MKANNQTELLSISKEIDDVEILFSIVDADLKIANEFIGALKHCAGTGNIEMYDTFHTIFEHYLTNMKTIHEYAETKRQRINSKIEVIFNTNMSN